MELRSVFIGNVKKYRKLAGLSQMVLAEKCHSSTSYIGEIEIGKKFPSVEMIQKIAVALNVQPYKLFMEDNDSYLATLPPEKKELLIENLHNAIVKVVNQNEI